MNYLLFMCDKFYISTDDNFIYSAYESRFYGRDMTDNHFMTDMSMKHGNIRFQITGLQEISREEWKYVWELMYTSPIIPGTEGPDKPDKKRQKPVRPLR